MVPVREFKAVRPQRASSLDTYTHICNHIYIYRKSAFVAQITQIAIDAAIRRSVVKL